MAEATPLSCDIQRVGEGILCKWSNGVTLWFEDKADAAIFAANLGMMAAFGADSLDDPIERIKENEDG